MKLLNVLKVTGVATAIAAAMLTTTVQTASARTLKLAHVLPTNHPVHSSLVYFAKQVSKRAHLRIKVYPNGTLGSEKDLQEMVQNGAIAFTKISSVVLESFSDDYKVLSLPYLYRNEKHYKHVVDGKIGAKILASSEKDGFVGLAFLNAGSRSFYTNKPINTPADLKGLKVRVQNSALAIKTINALGGTAVPLAYGELYSALQQGVVEAAENNLPSYFSSRHYEVAKHFSWDQHSKIPDVLVISTRVWHKLSSKQRRVIRQVAKETIRRQDKNWGVFVGKAVKTLEKQGITFHHPKAAPFQAAVAGVYDDFKNDNPKLIPLLNEIQNTK